MTDVTTLPEAIDNEKAEITASIEYVNKTAKEVVKILEEIEVYNKIFLDTKRKLDDPTNGLTATLGLSQKIKGEIEILKQGSDNFVQEIKNSLASVKSIVSEINTAHSNFTSINEKVNNSQTGLGAVLIQATNLKDSIGSLKIEAEANLKEIKDILGSIDDKEKQASKAFVDFIETKKKIDDPQSGFLAILNNSTELQQRISAVQVQSNTLHEEIKKVRDESVNYNSEIADFKKQSEADAGLIKDLGKQSLDFKNKIAQIYQIATGSGLANSFDKRKAEIKKTEKIWYITLIASTVALLAIVLSIYFTALYNGTLGSGSAFWYKLTFSSPLIFFVAFATERYTHERNLLEKYAFKSATAFALESYTTLLKHTFTSAEHEKQILDFVLGSMEVIYKEPFESKRETKWSLGLNSKIGDMKAEIAEIREEVAKKLEKVALTGTTQ